MVGRGKKTHQLTLENHFIGSVQYRSLQSIMYVTFSSKLAHFLIKNFFSVSLKWFSQQRTAIKFAPRFLYRIGSWVEVNITSYDDLRVRAP